MLQRGRYLRRALLQLEQQRWQSSVPAPAPEMPQMPAYDYTPPPYTGPSKEKVLALRKQYLSPGMGVCSLWMGVAAIRYPPAQPCSTTLRTPS